MYHLINTFCNVNSEYGHLLLIFKKNIYPGLGREGDILIPHWDLGKPVALDEARSDCHIYAINSSTLMEAGVTSGSVCSSGSRDAQAQF